MATETTQHLFLWTRNSLPFKKPRCSVTCSQEPTFLHNKRYRNIPISDYLLIKQFMIINHDKIVHTSQNIIPLMLWLVSMHTHCWIPVDKMWPQQFLTSVVKHSKNRHKWKGKFKCGVHIFSRSFPCDFTYINVHILQTLSLYRYHPVQELELFCIKTYAQHWKMSKLKIGGLNEIHILSCIKCYMMSCFDKINIYTVRNTSYLYQLHINKNIRN
jgi:hypothetical protein